MRAPAPDYEMEQRLTDVERRLADTLAAMAVNYRDSALFQAVEGVNSDPSSKGYVDAGRLTARRRRPASARSTAPAGE